MAYPTVRLEDAREVVRERLSGELQRRLPPGRIEEKKGPDIDQRALERICQIDWAHDGAAKSPKRAEECEGHRAVDLYDALKDAPVQVLDDPAFWRYLAVGPLWPLVYWREKKTFDKGDPGKYLKYVDGKSVAECVPTRMYLRGAICALAGEAHLASAIESATDFWRSHILRVSIGEAPHVAAAFVRMQRDRRLSTNAVRSFARLLNRTSTNVVLAVYDHDEANQLITSLRERFDREEYTT